MILYPLFFISTINLLHCPCTGSVWPANVRWSDSHYTTDSYDDPWHRISSWRQKYTYYNKYGIITLLFVFSINDPWGGVYVYTEHSSKKRKKYIFSLLLLGTSEYPCDFKPLVSFISFTHNLLHLFSHNFTDNIRLSQGALSSSSIVWTLTHSCLFYFPTNMSIPLAVCEWR